MVGMHTGKPVGALVDALITFSKPALAISAVPEPVQKLVAPRAWRSHEAWDRNAV